jgi:hypothetical protein
MLTSLRLYRYIALFLLKLLKIGRLVRLLYRTYFIGLILPHYRTSHFQQVLRHH